MRILISLLFTISCINMLAQGGGASTYSLVFDIFQISCTSSGCHDADSAGGLNLVGTSSDVYNSIVGVNPTNNTAIAKGNKLIDPGHPYNSFLLRKFGNAFDSYFNLQANEGAAMQAFSGVSNSDIEIIRQWIIFGAPASGELINAQLISDFYNFGGQPFIPTPSIPNPADGFQMRIGPVFLGFGSQMEFMVKQRLQNASPLQISGLESSMYWSASIARVFNFEDNSTANISDGIRIAAPVYDAAIGDTVKSLLMQWTFSSSVQLPQETAFLIDETGEVDIQMNVTNFSPTHLLPADLYINFTYDTSQNPLEMKGAAIISPDINIPNDSSDHLFAFTEFAPFSFPVNLWRINGTTDNVCNDFDIYQRNPDGSRGGQLYEGFFNADYTVNQGFYNAQNPATREFDPFYSLDLEDGFIYEAQYNNQGSATHNTNMTLIYFFTTASCNTPLNLEVSNIQCNSTTLNWQAVDGAQAYILQGNLAGQAVDGIELIVDGSQNSFQAAGLSADATYVWRVMAVCDSSQGEISEPSLIDTFSTCCVTPIPSMSNIAATTATLNWTEGVTADHYKIRGNLDGFPPSVKLDIPDPTQTSYNVSGLLPNLTYYWQIKAFCNSDESISSSWSQELRFTTDGCLEPVPILTNSITSNSAVLNWTPVPGARGYQLRGGVTGGAYVSLSINDANASSTTASGLSSLTTYEWQIKTLCDPTGASAYSDLTTFTTNAFKWDEVEPENNENPSFYLFPNPANEKFVFQMDEVHKSGTIQILNSAGKVIYREKVNPSENSMIREIDISHVIPGVYLVSFTTSNNVTLKKLIKGL